MANFGNIEEIEPKSKPDTCWDKQNQYQVTANIIIVCLNQAVNLGEKRVHKPGF